MAKLQIDERKTVEENIFKYEERVNSPVVRLQETPPTLVTWYHINDNETTTDAGYVDVASIIGHRSPVKFQKIEGLPIYGLEAVVLQLQDEDQGIDTGFSSEATLAPKTITPYPGDFFLIPYLHFSCVFRVTEIMPDNIRPDNWYKIGYQLEYIDEEQINGLDNQTHEKFTCVLENIGSENRCIIEESYNEKIKEIDAMYDDIASTYMKIFYSDKHNCMLGEIGPGLKLYDPFQAVFLNKHGLFNKKNDFKTYMFTDQYDDPRQVLKYEKSVYRCVERREPKLVSTFEFTTLNGAQIEESTFYAVTDQSVLVLDTPAVMPPDSMKMSVFSPEFATSIKLNGQAETEYADLIQKFIRNEEVTIYDIPMTINDELLDLDANLEMFFVVPILMYIIKTVVNDFMHDKTSMSADHLDVE